MSGSAPISLPSCVVDLERFEVRRGDRVDRLTANEATILAYLVARAGRTVPRDELLTQVLGYRPGLPTRAIDSAVRRIRAKIEVDPSEPLHLVSVYGVGYRFQTGEAAPPEPAPGGPFFGRTAELEAIAERLLRPGLVTLVGPGGVGKTRTAREVAGDGLFVPLADVRTADDLVHRVAGALGFALGAGDRSAHVVRVGRALAARGGVLVVDNLEQIEGAGGVVEAWTTTAPELRLLATSRRRLGIPGEQVVELPPLDHGAAVALLRSWLPGGEPAADDGALDAIARHLDHLPLALELAGARLRRWTPAELQGQLARTLHVLSPSEPREARRTLRGTVMWSLELLGDDARQAFAQAGAFAGGFDLAAWVAVVRTEADPVDVLEALIEHSLVRAERTAAGTRLRMLEPVREVVVELARDPACFERHARFYLAEADARRDAAVLRGELDWHERERDNLLAAFAHAPAALRGPLAMALEAVLLPRGPLVVREEVLSRALSADDLSPSLRAELTWRHADTIRLLGRASEARERLELAVDLARRCGDRRVEGVVIGTAGAFAVADADYPRAEALLREAIAIHREVGNARSEGSSRFNLANLQKNRGELAEAEAGFREALRGLERAGDTVLPPAVLSGLAMLHLDLGHVDEARTLLERALGPEERTIGTHRLYVRLNLGHVQLAGRWLDEARRTFASLVADARRVGDQFVLPDALHGSALALLLTGDPASAEPLLDDARRLHRQLGRPLFEALVQAHAAVALRERGLLHEARAVAREAVAGVEAVGAAWLAEALAHAAAAEAEAGDLPAAEALLDRASGLGGAAALRDVVGHHVRLRAGGESPAEAMAEARSASGSSDVDVRLEARALDRAARGVRGA